MQPLLLFHNHLYNSSNLIEGRLLLIDKEADEIIDQYIATSGLPSYQEFKDVSIKGKGSIPPTIPTVISRYQVLTKPIPMPEKKGIEGNFYKVDPHTVVFSGVQRGDFGIHRDANAPGSAGCIVLTTTIGWSTFEQTMKDLSSNGVKFIPLLVSYAR